MKELEVQYQSARYEAQRKAQEQEANKSKQLTSQVSTFSQTETELRSQLNIYVEKFKQVGDPIKYSSRRPNGMERWADSDWREQMVAAAFAAHNTATAAAAVPPGPVAHPSPGPATHLPPDTAARPSPPDTAAIAHDSPTTTTKFCFAIHPPGPGETKGRIVPGSISSYAENSDFQALLSAQKAPSNPQPPYTPRSPKP